MAPNVPGLTGQWVPRGQNAGSRRGRGRAKREPVRTAGPVAGTAGCGRITSAGTGLREETIMTADETLATEAVRAAARAARAAAPSLAAARDEAVDAALGAM